MEFDPAPIIEYFKLVVIGLILSIVFIPVIYVAFRAASLAWYKSRYEHFRKVWKHQDGEDK